MIGLSDTMGQQRIRWNLAVVALLEVIGKYIWKLFGRVYQSQFKQETVL
jgi:hypothetical protein